MTTGIPRYSSEDVLYPLGIEVNSFDQLYLKEGILEPMHEHHRAAFYQLFRYQGAGNLHYVQNKTIMPETNDLLLINRDIVQRYSLRECSGDMVFFDAVFFGKTREKMDFLNHSILFRDDFLVIPMHLDMNAGIVDSYFSLMKKIWDGNKPPEIKTIILRNWLHNLLITAETGYCRHQNCFISRPKNQNYALQFKILLNAHYQTQKQVRFYAEQLEMTEKMLSRIVAGLYGISAKEYINEKLLREAVRLLKNTTLNQSEIACELGFDFSWFVKFFRKNMGITPAKYRQQE